MATYAPSGDQSRQALYQMMGELLSVSGQLPDFTQEQWQRIVHFSGDALVVAQLYKILEANDLLDQLPDDINSYLQVVFELNAVRTIKLLATFTRLAKHLNSAGIHPVPLKGIALLAGNKPGEPLRSSRITYDVDVLVRAEELQSSLQVLQSAAYQQVVNPLDKLTENGESPILGPICLEDFRNNLAFTRSHVPPLVDEEGDCIIDLHTAAATLNNPRATKLTQLLFDLSVLEIDDAAGVSYSMPDPVAQLVLAVYHAHIKNRHQFLGIVDWRLLLDMTAVLQAYPERALVEETLSTADALDMSREMFTAWKLVARYLNVNINLEGFESTRNMRALSWFYRKSEWRWLAASCELWIKIGKAFALLSVRELKQSLGAQSSFTGLIAHLSYRIQRTLNR